jgi:hypothetical protein
LASLTTFTDEALIAFDTLGERAASLETLRALDADDLERLAAAVGLRSVHRGGVMVKPLPNDLMAALPEAVLEGLLRAARHLPEMSAMAYVVLQ